jgi:hypothetical protein
MTWKDKLEIGLKEDAPYRRDNLPEFEKEPGGPRRKAGDPTRSPVEPAAVDAARESAHLAKRRTARAERTRRPRRRTARSR